jgi:hypothetical protein
MDLKPCPSCGAPLVFPDKPTFVTHGKGLKWMTGVRCSQCPALVAVIAEGSGRGKPGEIVGFQPNRPMRVRKVP